MLFGIQSLSEDRGHEVGANKPTVDVGRYSKEKMHAAAKIDLEAESLSVGIVRCSSTIQRLSFLAFFWQNS